MNGRIERIRTIDDLVEWLHLFVQPANAQILLDFLEYLQENAGLTLYGYVRRDFRRQGH